ncbi:TetR/AcrR family transcriptional regulator [Leisingera sp. SS27]|uniref:TetR/AcrR family transcriptional regulator n=1 Tax=Leisingera sp. SS27 TaxID=2979462 RepID=UPI00232C9518|nr:TetR/AcrR family transcriptional regulator [Leisingera sp. SS27]MDC0660573.1 TetR/AcrR family transcriptional regulator [Leisingera sp. SS27]
MTDKSKAPPDRKTALLDSAERAARSRGFDGFSYADLAKDVGIRTASIHYHFPSKADLSTALMQRYHESFAAICEEIDAHHATGGARLQALIDRYRIAHNDAQWVCLCVAFSISRESLSPEVVGQISRFRAMMRKWIGAVFELGRSDGTILNTSDSAIEAAATLSLLEGAQLSARAEENPARFEEAMAHLASRVR